MAYIHDIYKDIAGIISQDYDHDLLTKTLSNTNFDWELLVKVGSNQLILPAIYCNLKTKNLLQHLPEDLQQYLDEIASINRNRNKTILEEAESIASLFKDNNIDYVFLKGTALVISGYYKDLGERMIGDIDILVHPDQLIKTQDLLLKNGYDEAKTTFGSNFFEHKHLARLISKTKLAAVEVHRKLLQKTIKNKLQALDVLKNKQVINGIAICSDDHLLEHAVLNFQINDYGYYYNFLGLRNAYDALIISEKLSEPHLKTLMSKKYLRSFSDKMNVYFNLDEHHKKGISRYINTRFFVWKQKNKLVSKLSFVVLNLINVLSIFTHRLFFFIGNASYRKESLKDHKRILKLIKKHMYPF